MSAREASGRVTLAFATVALAASLPSCGIRDGYVRAKQVRTFADLQVITERIDDAISKNRGMIQPSQAREVILGVNGGRDAWGNEILFHSNVRDGKFTYVLVSPGEDGKLDLASLDDYFGVPVSSVHGLGGKDIVFRDGQPVTMGGK